MALWPGRAGSAGEYETKFVDESCVYASMLAQHGVKLPVEVQPNGYFLGQ